MQDAANRGSIKTVQIKGPNTNWQTLNNVWGASWETGQVPQTPLDFRIQDDTGIDVSCPHPCYGSDGTAYLPSGHSGHMLCETTLWDTLRHEIECLNLSCSALLIRPCH